MAFIVTKLGMQFDETNFVGSPKLNSGMNSGEDLIFGGCVASTFEFDIYEIEGLSIPSLVGQEFDVKIRGQYPYIFLDGSILTFPSDRGISSLDKEYWFGQSDWPVGKFTVTDVYRTNDYQWHVTCFDRMIKLDKDVTALFNVCVQRQTDIRRLYYDIFAACGVDPPAFPSEHYSIWSRQISPQLRVEQITGRQFISDVLELMGCYGYFDYKGEFCFGEISTTTRDVDATNILDVKVAEYKVARIDGTQATVRQSNSSNNINSVWPNTQTAVNPYVLSSNIIAYGWDYQSCEAVMSSLYSRINSIEYTPAAVTVLQTGFLPNANYDGSLNPLLGTLVRLNTERHAAVTTLVMSMTTTDNLVYFESTGNPTRSATQSMSRSKVYLVEDPALTLSSIAITNLPNKTVYRDGQPFDRTGMVVTATYSDNSTAVVTDYNVSPDWFGAAGNFGITISFAAGGITKTTQLTVTVHPVSVRLVSIAVTKPPNKMVYTAGELFDRAGMVVTATYSNNSTVAITGYTVTPSWALSVADTAVRITYSEEGDVPKTAQQAITVNPIS